MPDGPDGEAKIIDAIYRGVCDSAELARALELIAANFDSPGVFLCEMDSVQPENEVAVGARTVDQEFFADYGVYAEFDPMPRVVAARSVGTVGLTDRLLKESVIRKN